MLTGQVAKEVGVTRPTVRTWASRFAEWLSAEASVVGQTRNFSAEDLQVLKGIKALRNRNLSFDEIEAQLRTGELPIPEQPAEPAGALVTMAQVQALMIPLASAVDEWRAIAEDRRVEIESLKAELAEARKPWWARVLGR